jgi:IS5 family transposase
MALSYRKPTFSTSILQELLDPNDRLMKLAELIDWEDIHDRLRPYYSTVGRQALPIRLMVGLHLLKHRDGLSDGQCAERIRGDLYWMYFCGVDPDSLKGIYRKLDASSMTKFRNRIGEKGFLQVEAVIRHYLQMRGHIDASMMTTDSACLEKHIYYPTDSNLLYRGTKNLLRSIRKLQEHGIKRVKGLRTFARRSKQIVVMMAKLGKDRMERIKKGTLELARQAVHVANKSEKMLENLKRAIKRGVVHNVSSAKRIAVRLRTTIKIIRHVVRQARARFKGRHLPKKIYSLHEPDVVCIRKEKTARPNEYGMKFNLSVDRNGIIVAHESVRGSTHDAKLLDPALKHWEQVTGKLPDQLNADRAYRQKKRKTSRRVKSIRRLCIPPNGQQKHPDRDKSWYRNGIKLRARIEGTIGHIKARGRCRYRGRPGSKIHLAIKCTCWNLNKISQLCL